MICRSRLSSSARASSARSAPSRSSSGPAAASDTPSRRSITSTCPVHSPLTGAGTTTPAPARLAAAPTAVRLLASIRRSSSSRSAAANPRASVTAPIARPHRVARSSRWASRPRMSRSLSTVPRTPGRRTFTTTASPEVSVAACTCATDAAAIGVRSRLAKISSGSAPSSVRSTSSIAGQATGAAWS